MGRSQNLHDISVTQIHETQKAILYDDGTQKFWVPKSIIGRNEIVQVEDKDDGSITLTAPEWWFVERELI